MLRGLILIGGKSSRLGQDKYALKLHDKPQFLFLKDLFDQLNIKCYFSINKAQEASFKNHSNTIVDVYDEIGPMGGLASAFQLYPDDPWLVVACDMPFVSIHTLKRLIEAQSENYDIITYQKLESSFPETTITLYKSTSLIEDSIRNKDYRLQKLLRGSKVLSVLPKNNEELYNLNDPGDLKYVQKYFSETHN